MAIYIFFSTISIISFILNLIIVITKKVHIQFTGDINFGPQKIHKSQTPRIGGIGIYMTLILTLMLLNFFYYDQRDILFGNLLSIIIITLPAIIVGLAEDLYKDISIFFRFCSSLVVGLIAYFHDVSLSISNINFIDEHLIFYNLLPFLTIIFFAGSINSINLIDGINGLAGLTSIIILITLSQLAFLNNDYNNYYFTFLIIGTILGFLIINWLTGSIFLGDSGAYLLGAMLAYVACNVLNQNDLSLLNIFTLFAYPIWEITNSMIRRLYNNKKITIADNKHLHSFAYIWVSKNFKNKNTSVKSSLTTLFLLPLITIGPITTLFFYENPRLLVFSFLMICIFSSLIYAKLNYKLNLTKKLS